jgi:hypothetical protein
MNFIMISFLLIAGTGQVERLGPLFATWRTSMEVDKLASAWLIERFVKPGASILLTDSGAVVDKAIFFDVPGGAFNRTFNKSTYENIADYYKITDPKTRAVGLLVHDIEINTWERKLYMKTANVQDSIQSLIHRKLSDSLLVARSLDYFDWLAKSLNGAPERIRP